MAPFGFEFCVFALLYAALGGAAAVFAVGWAGGCGMVLARRGQLPPWTQVVFTVTTYVGLSMLVLAIPTLGVTHPPGVWGLLFVVGLILIGYSSLLRHLVKRRCEGTARNSA